jgi:class 3 adenylate cyclase
VSAGEQSILSLHRREICYVFVDLRGFTAFTDTTEPEEVQAVLHDYHAAMGPLITEHEGTLDRFAGDGILVFFNDPLPVSEPPRRAARMALAMRERFAVLREQWLDNGYDLDLGIGIARGYATLGAFGFEGRFDYSAIGGVVNLAARLCGEANSGQILIDQRMRAALGETFVIEPVGKMALKGFVQAVTAFQLTGERNPVPPRD